MIIPWNFLKLAMVLSRKRGEILPEQPSDYPLACVVSDSQRVFNLPQTDIIKQFSTRIKRNTDGNQ